MWNDILGALQYVNVRDLVCYQPDGSCIIVLAVIIEELRYSELIVLFPLLNL
jgi:hypothetical protein